MPDVTLILSEIENGETGAADRLLTVVYAELRKLAAANMANEPLDHTLQATALVHEAYLRLIGSPSDQHWEGRAHFFASAAEAMRRILVEKARKKSRLKHGGQRERVTRNADELRDQTSAEEILAVHEALEILESKNPQAAQITKLRYFAGMTIPEVAESLQISARTADGIWSYARAWLLSEFRHDDQN